MNAKELLNDYEDLESGLYLRKDGKGIAFESENKDHLAFFALSALSRESFIGKGLILYGDLMDDFHIVKRRSFLEDSLDKFSSAKSKELREHNKATSISEDTFKANNSKELMNITKSHLVDFLNEHGQDYDNPADYLSKFANFPCEEYATNTPINKIRNAVATLDLRFSPFKYGQRKMLRDQIREQIPQVVNVMYTKLCEYAESDDAISKSQIKEFEKIAGLPIDELATKTRDEILYSFSKNALRTINFTATRNVADYSIDTCINSYSREDGVQKVKNSVYKHSFKINFK